jgi:hypothetical protein
MGNRYSATVRRWATALLVAAGLVFANAQAAPILQVVGGKLTGAKGVDVGGTLYDVEFLDGTCIAVFSGCDATADFTFTTPAGAAAASQALLDQVFLDVPAGNFDSDPSLTQGCGNPIICVIDTPNLLPATGVVSSSASTNFNSVGPDPVGGSLFSIFLDTGDLNAVTWARWSPAVQSASEPGTIAILGAGLLALVMTRRRRTQTLDGIQ